MYQCLVFKTNSLVLVIAAAGRGYEAKCVRDWHPPWFLGYLYLIRRLKEATLLKLAVWAESQ